MPKARLGKARIADGADRDQTGPGRWLAGYDLVERHDDVGQPFRFAVGKQQPLSNRRILRFEIQASRGAPGSGPRVRPQAKGLIELSCNDNILGLDRRAVRGYDRIWLYRNNFGVQQNGALRQPLRKLSRDLPHASIRQGSGAQ